MSKLPFHPLPIGKLLDIANLVERVEGTELYACFDPARLEDAKALFVWACGDGIDKPAGAVIAARRLEVDESREVSGMYRNHKFLGVIEPEQVAQDRPLFLHKVEQHTLILRLQITNSNSK